MTKQERYTLAIKALRMWTDGAHSRRECVSASKQVLNDIDTEAKQREEEERIRKEAALEKKQASRNRIEAVMQMLTNGLRKVDIAKRLGVSATTIWLMIEKEKARQAREASRVDLNRIAIEAGTISNGDRA